MSQTTKKSGLIAGRSNDFYTFHTVHSGPPASYSKDFWILSLRFKRPENESDY